MPRGMGRSAAQMPINSRVEIPKDDKMENERMENQTLNLLIDLPRVSSEGS